MTVHIYDVDPSGIIKADGFAHSKRCGVLQYKYTLQSVSSIVYNDDSVSFLGNGMLLFKLNYDAFSYFSCY